MKRLFLFVITLLLLFTGCTGDSSVSTFTQISQDEAKKMMDSQNVIILDVREQYEFEEGHIPEAVLFPLGSIAEDTATEMIPTKDSVVLVYCRSGNRSKTASQKLVELGYTAVYEFGGITTWPYEVVK